MSDADSGSTATLAALVGALGVVFGDIGTSPLYAMRAALGEVHPLDATTVYGLTSTVIWSMLAVVTGLYVGLLLRADNQGEGGLLALVGLLRRSPRGRVVSLATTLGMLGAALFLGDSVITPAISVLSASEGLEVVDPALKAVVLPIALGLLVGVFLLQRRGSGGIGRVYGPVMVVWFATLAAGGAYALVQHPSALQALSPSYAVRFFLDDPLVAFLSLGSVVLAVTGAEALYADLAHFGRAAISRSWLLIVFPALVIAYLGEAGTVVSDRTAATNPFYAVVPGWATVPVLVLATAATVIASEAVIAGAFTVLHQAGGLGVFPFLRTEHPSERHAGQIYIPAANWALALAVLAVVAGFGSSDRLASAYGVAVSATMLVTVTLYLLHQYTSKGRPTVRSVVAALLSIVVLALFAACLPKVVSGGWLPLCLAALLFLVMATWRRGRIRMAAAVGEQEAPLEQVLEELSADHELRRVDGTAVFLTDRRDVAPRGLSAMVERTRTLHRYVVLLSWDVEDTPRASPHEVAAEVDVLGPPELCVRAVHVTLGYRERLDAVAVLRHAVEERGDLLQEVDPESAFFFVSDSIPALRRRGSMPLWRQRLFLALDRLSTDRVAQLRLPRERAMVIGREVPL